MSNSRLFLGNLAAEKTSTAQLREIFSKYGTLTEEPTLHKSFGFVQYDNPASAQAAIDNENGRMIGGLRLDINFANRKGDRGGGDSRDHHERSRRRSASPPRRRSPSPPRSSRSSDATGQIVYIGMGQKPYVQEIHRSIKARLGLDFDLFFIEGMSIKSVMEKAHRRGFRYVVIAGSQNERKNTMNLNILKQNRDDDRRDDRLEENISLERCIDLIARDSNIKEIPEDRQPRARDHHQQYSQQYSQSAPQQFQLAPAAATAATAAPAAAALLNTLAKLDPQAQANVLAILSAFGQQSVPQAQPVYAMPAPVAVAAPAPQYSYAPLQNLATVDPYAQYRQPQLPPGLLQQSVAYVQPSQSQSQPQSSTATPQQPPVAYAVSPPVQPASSQSSSGNLSSLLSAYAAGHAQMAQATPAPSANAGSVDVNSLMQSLLSPGSSQQQVAQPSHAFPKIGFQKR